MATNWASRRRRWDTWKAASKGVSPMICQIVNRCHVGQSNRAVIKYVISRLVKKYQTFTGMPKADRKAFMRQCIKAHEANRTVYRLVQRG